MTALKKWLAWAALLAITLFAPASGALAQVASTTPSSTQTSVSSTAPSVPGGLMANTTSPTSVMLSWTASTASNASSTLTYTIFRDGTMVGTTAVGATSFTDTGLSPGTSYSYTVSSTDNLGNTSVQSSSVTVQTPSSSVTSSSTVSSNISVPTNLKATDVSPSEIDLSWTASAITSTTSSSTTAVAGYVVFRDGTQVATPSGSTYTDTGLAANTTYTYMVSAFDGSGNSSAMSNSISATTLASGGSTSTPPSIPTGLTVNVLSPSSIMLTWTASTSTNASSTVNYNVYRNGVLVGTTSAGVTSFTDTGLAAGTSYSYTISATDNVGNASGQSVSVTGQTQSGSGTSTTTPPSFPPPANGIWGWAAIPLNLYNAIYNASTTSGSIPAPPFTYINGYPTINGNYIDCNGNVDNDPAHHTTNPADTDPAHHTGQNCPNGMPVFNSSGAATANSPGSSPNSIFSIFNTSGQSVQWTLVPLTSDFVQRLQSFISANPTSVMP